MTTLTKKTISRILIGFPLGVFINATISLIISLCQKELIVLSPILINRMGGMLPAYCVQYLLSGIVGATFAGCSVIFEVEQWSLFKQSMLHFFPTSLLFLMVSLLCGWMPVDALGIFIFLILFFFLYLFSWISQYHFWKKQIQATNNKFKQ